MPAPANDNIANATTITGLSGSLISNNNLATTETGEPGWPTYNPAATYPQLNSILNPSSTVWYEWTCPAFSAPPNNVNGYSYGAPPYYEVIFYTEPINTVFASVIQIFSGTVGTPPNTFTYISEVDYVVNEAVGQNNGLSNASAVSFLATSGTTYYIRVGGRVGSTNGFGNQGQFGLAWSVFNRPTLGSCSKCQPTGIGNLIGSLQVGNPVVGSIQYFPTVGGGVFEIKYCKGSMIVQAGSDPYWSISAGTVGSYSQTLSFSWPEGSWTPLPSGTAPDVKNTPTEVEIEYECQTSGQFVSCGGSFTMTYADNLIADNESGSPNPMFSLIQIPPSSTIPGITSVNTGSSLSGTNPTWTGTFIVNNSTSHTYSSVTATILNTDGVSSGSSVTLNLVPGPNNVIVTFTADIQNVFCTANIQLTFCGGNLGILSYPLYPIITVSNTYQPPTGSWECYPNYLCDPPGSYANLAYVYSVNSIPTEAQMGGGGITSILTSAPFPLTIFIPCTTIANKSTNYWAPGSYVNDLLINCAVGGNNTVTIITTCAGLTYPPYIETRPAT